MSSLDTPGGRVAICEISIDFKLLERKASTKGPYSSDIVIGECLSPLFHLTQQATQVIM
jgi:hypothetical protein